MSQENQGTASTEGKNRAPIELTPIQVSIMGCSSPRCVRVADILIRNGVYEFTSHEAECKQAVFIHWALGLADKYGDDWSDVGQAFLKKLVASEEACP